MKKLILIISLMACAFLLKAQNRAITGTVTDSKKLPLPGITVTVLGTKTATQTDANGKYTINAENESTLEFKALGFSSQTIKVGTNTTLNISLTDETTNLDAVTVVGYTTKKKSEISSAVTTVSGAQLNDVTSVNLGNLLQGKAPGVVASSASGDPTAGSTVVVRGVGTINAGIGPLVVVDGNIGGTYNPADVDNITILRDAAATGLYGSRAANGVIIVTTKKGKAGETRFSLNSAVGFAKATTGNFQLMDAQQLYDYQKTFFTTPPAPSLVNTNTNWWDEAFRTAMVNNHTLTASGGSEKSQFYISGNYFKEEGTLINNDKTQYSLRANLTSQLTKKLKLNALLSGIVINDNINPESAVYQAYLNMPYDPAYNADGSPTDPRNIPSWKGRDRSNFLQSLQYNYSRARSFTSTGDINLDYDLLKNLTISSYNRATIASGRSNNYYDRRSQSGATNLGTASLSNTFATTLLSSNRIKYSVNIGQHNFSILGVAEIESYKYDVNGITAKGLPAGMDAINTATDITNKPTGSYDGYKNIKYLAQADYSYQSKYYLVASVVNEYASRFGKNNPAATFYQFGTSWILSNESFLKDNKTISFLKLRASAGTTGNQGGIDYYQSFGLYNLNAAASYNGQTGAFPTQIANPDLTWEKSRTYNLGLDFSLFKRIDVTIDAYDKRNSDLLFAVPLPSTVGYANIRRNIGAIRNRGIEFTINSKNIQLKDFNWETNFNMSFNRNKVMELNQGLLVVNTSTQPIALGHDMDEWYMQKWAGVNPADGKPLWEKLDDPTGVTSTYNQATRQYTGKSSAPKFSGGLTNTLNYKNFTLSAFLNFVYGNWVYNDSRFYFDNDGVYESYNQQVLPKGSVRWTTPGQTDATHPQAKFGGNLQSHQTSTRFLENGSYLRLRNVTVGYNLPANWLKKASINAARLYVSGDNLFTATKFSGVDPEVDLTGGISSFRYPTSRRFVFGVNLTF
ncbi:hypothetical protein OC25_15130 [Pedobacter kyungheensis]|uniref:TonB-dependent receptor n=1 Tax=Pedobacter kyungheensis TaxID=1069985 RepID=A0A0C1FYS9_9SPHI|nr:TonB-dependent receptor [Pedobacter kyungheensis]KIA93024.1 hypothetical protein OC25_15130 [Pedobacter kyungheensis]